MDCLEECEKILEHFGWSLDCWSPFNISHPDGSKAQGAAANIVFWSLKEDYKEEVGVKFSEIDCTGATVNEFYSTPHSENTTGNRISITHQDELLALIHLVKNDDETICITFEDCKK